MKKILMLAVFASAFSALPALFALAQDAPVKAPHERGPGRFFEKMDIDGDGIVTKEEFLKAHEGRFTKMDADGDGKITKDEADAMKRAMHEKHGKMKDRIKDKVKPQTEDKAGTVEPAEDETGTAE